MPLAFSASARKEQREKFNLSWVFLSRLFAIITFPPTPGLSLELRSKFYILVKRKQIEKEAIFSWHEKIPHAFGSSTRAKYEIQFLLG